MEFLFQRDKENNDQSDFEASSDFENEADDDIDSGTHLYSEVLLLRNSLFCNRVSMSIVLNLLFHCFRHCSVQKIRPEYLKIWFRKGGSLLC